MYRPGQFDADHRADAAADRLATAWPTSPRPPSAPRPRSPTHRIQVLDGHGHFAHKTDPAMVAAVVQYVRRRRRMLTVRWDALRHPTARSVAFQ